MKRCTHKQSGYIVLILLIVYTTFLSGWAVAHGWKSPPEAAQIINPLEMNEDSIHKGKKPYVHACASCHGMSARGGGPKAKYLGQEPADLLKRIENHSEGDFFWKISTGRGEMPGFEDKLTKHQIWSIINYIKSLKGK